MIEIRIHGRGGQGGVTLAKILATTYHLQGKSVQAFGIYAAERSGAPLQAFLRADDEPIANRNLIYEPDHIVVLDPTLVSPQLTSGLKPEGFILINTPESMSHFGSITEFRGYRLAIVDATKIAKAHKLGTKTVPIVNTALVGATAKMLGMDLQNALKAFDEMGFHGGNADAAKDAYEEVQIMEKPECEANVDKPVLPTARVKGLVDGNTGAPPALRTGNWAVQQPARKNSVPPCNFLCPAGNDVQGFLDALAKDNLNKALEILSETTPLPSVCGRVCPGFCMAECNRAKYDEPVNVRALERYVGDRASYTPKPRSVRQERVAVVGSGPAGLSGAYQLARLGYQVTIFEGDSELGGLMRTGIPSYRLPREALDKDIDRVLQLGVKTVLNTRVEKDQLQKMRKEFDAVVAATGLQKQTSLELGAHADHIMQGLDFLDLARNKSMQVQDEEVIVLGGGNTAIDAARSAFRLGAKNVRVVYRRTRQEMPAIEEEVDEAIDEGIQIDFLMSPVKIIKMGKRNLLICQRMELGEPDDSGRRRPVPIPDSEFEIPFDRVLLALGQSADLSLIPEDAVMSRDADVKGAAENLVVGAGDMMTNEGTVTAAIGCGRDIALRLHERFSGEKLYTDPPQEDEVVRSERIKFDHFEKAPRGNEVELPFSERKSFDEVKQGLSSAEEAQRCMSCGVCNNCDRCVTYCPDGVLRRVGDDLVFDYDYCKGCGVCVKECSRAVIYMGTN